MNVQEKATRIFDAIFDEEDLKNLESKGIIAQELGYKVSVIAQIELELESEWVSFEDKVPAERCLAYTPSEHNEIRYRIIPAGLFRQAASEATHWMPLPTPPKELE